MTFAIRRAIAVFALLAGLMVSVSAASQDTVTVIPLNPTANEQGLQPGSVTFHRTGAQDPLTVTYTITGNTTSAGNASSDLSGGYISGLLLTSLGSGYYGTSFSFNIGSASGTAYSNGGYVPLGASNVQVTAAGLGYTSVPGVIINGGGGTGAIAQVTLSGSGGVVSITITNPGSGYTSAPSVQFNPGGAAATATISGGSVTGVTISNPGGGYSIANPPTINFIGGGATTPAAGTANVGLSISQIFVTSPGSGYSSIPTISIDPPQLAGGTQATAIVTGINGSPLSNVLLNSPGTGSATPPTITISDAGGTHGSSAVAVVENQAVAGVAIANGGSGFVMPVVTITPPPTGTTASGEVVVDGGVVTAVRLLSVGSGYTTAPTVTISNPLGYSAPATFATVTANIANGQVASLVLTNNGGGNGYVTPTVTATPIPNPGTSATFSATTDEGVVTGVTVNYGGTGYGGPASIPIPDSSPHVPISSQTDGVVTAILSGADYHAPDNSYLNSSGVVTGTVFFPIGVTDVTLSIYPLRNGVGGGRTINVVITPNINAYITGTQSTASIVIADADVSATIQVLDQIAYPTLPTIPTYFYPLEVQGAADWYVQFLDNSGNQTALPWRQLIVSMSGDPSIGPEAQQGTTYTLVKNQDYTLAQMLTSTINEELVIPPFNPVPNPIPLAPGPGDTVVTVASLFFPPFITSYQVGDMIFFHQLEDPPGDDPLNGVYTITGLNYLNNQITFTPPLKSHTVYNQTLVKRVGAIVQATGSSSIPLNIPDYGFIAHEAYYAVPVRNLGAPPRGQNSMQLTIVQSSDYRTLTPTNGTAILADDAVTAGLEFQNNAGKPNTPGVALAVFTQPFPIPVNVPFVVESTSTAQYGTDYTITGVDPTTLVGQLQIPAGATSAAITVTPLTATGASLTNTEVDLRILPSPNYLLAPAGTSPVNPTATINVAPVPVTNLGEPVYVSVVATSGDAGPSPNNPNGPTNGNFRLSLTDIHGNPLVGTVATAMTVNYTIGGTAVPGLDYVPLTLQTIPPTGTAVIPGGAHYVDVPVVIQNDGHVTGNKSVTMTLNSNTSYQVSLLSNDTVTINDYGPELSIATTLPAAVNGAAGIFTITNPDPITTPVTLHYTATGTAVAGTDYQTLSGVVIIPAGIYPNPVTATIPVFAGLTGLGKTITVTLVADPLTPANYGLSTPITATMTVVPAATIVATTPAIINSSSPGIFTVTMSATSSSTRTVFYTATGSAVAGTDYTALTGSVSIPANATSATIAVNGAVGSAANKVLIVQLLNDTATPATYGLATISSATMNFANAVTIANTSSALSAGGSAVFTVTQPIAQTTATTITFTLGGSAIVGTDYTSPGNTVTIPAGATSAAITVTTMMTGATPGRTVSITLQPSTATPAAYTLGSNVTATTTLFNTVTIAETTAATTTVQGVFTVTMSTASATATTIYFGESGNAAAGTDYTALPASLTIAAGNTSGFILVNALANSNKTLTITVNPDILTPATYYIATPAPSASMILGINNVAPVITSAATATATVGQSFNYQITAQNSPSSFAATNLPNGLTINTGTGVISGTPTQSGSTTVNLSAANTYGTGTQSLVISITGGSSTTSGGTTAVLPVSSGGGGKSGCGLGGGALGLIFGLLALRRRSRQVA
jgi:hypothetical protein